MSSILHQPPWRTLGYTSPFWGTYKAITDHGGQVRFDQAPTAEQIERSQRAHVSGLTPAQRDRLNADHANNYDTTAVENRRDYTGPRWPWLCG